jgi:hypothetical protein
MFSRGSGMDLSVLNTVDSSEDGAWMPVLDLDWETPLGCSILVIGPDSKAVTVIADEEERYAQKRLAESFAGNKKTSGDNVEISADKAIRKACKLTKNWKDIEWAGAPFPYSEANAEKLYTKIPHIRTQVLNFYRDRANFTSPEYANWRKRFVADSPSTSPAKME